MVVGGSVSRPGTLKIDSTSFFLGGCMRSTSIFFVRDTSVCLEGVDETFPCHVKGRRQPFTAAAAVEAEIFHCLDVVLKLGHGVISD